MWHVGTAMPFIAASSTTLSHHGVDEPYPLDAPDGGGAGGGDELDNVQCAERYPDTTVDIDLPCDAAAHWYI